MTPQRVQQIVKTGMGASVVKRYDLLTMGNPGAYEECHIGEIPPNCQIEGNFVTVADYLSLQAALREALDGWYRYSKTLDNLPDDYRINILRAQFLDDK